MSINKVIILGNIGKDPEVRFSQQGTAFANTSIATSEKWKDKQTGEQKEKTEWTNLVFSGRLAEVVGEYVKKGSKLYVEGKLETRKWTNQQGQDQYTTEVKVFQMEMLDSKPQQQAPQQQGSFQQQAPQQGGFAPQAPQQAPSQQLAQKRNQAQQQNFQNNQNQSQNYGQPAQPTPDFDDD